MIIKICIRCKKQFKTKPSRINIAKFCSVQCRQKFPVSKEVRKKIALSRIKNVFMNCLKCNKPFETKPYKIKNGRKYCSLNCLNESKIGVIFTNERIKNISRARKGKMTGKSNPRWRGGKHLSRGYVLVLQPNHPHKNNMNHVFEHRLVMENYLERYLTKEEVVHHINEIKNDNRIENLMLFKNGQDHLAHHRSLKDLRNYILAES